MSKENGKSLNTNTLIGFADERGNAWHYRKELQGEESNHYPLAIPVADVRRRLFGWDAVGLPLEATLALPNGQEMKITDSSRQVVVRSDTGAVLGVFKDSYQIHQYSDWLIDELGALVDTAGSDLAVGSAGLLENGGMAWVEIDLPETVKIEKYGENFRASLLASTSHNGKLSSTFKPVMTRVVCDNTLSGALGEKTDHVKVKHSKYSGHKISDAREALGIIFNAADDFAAEIARLCETEVSHRQFVKWLDFTVPMPTDEGRTKTLAEKKRDEMLLLWMHDPRVAPWTGTAWGVLQTANTWQSHFTSLHKGTDRGQKNIFSAATGKSFESDAAALATLDKVLVNA